MIARFLWHWLVLVVGLYILTLITPIHADSTSDLLWAALVLIIFNTIVKPIFLVISLPVLVLTLGLFLFVINGILLYCVPEFVPGFHVPGFMSAFIGGLILSLITALFTGWERRVYVRRVDAPVRRNDKVIDI